MKFRSDIRGPGIVNPSDFGVFPDCLLWHHHEVDAFIL